MKTRNKFQYILIFGLALFLHASLAHDIVVHEQITLNAASSAATYSTEYNSFLNTISSDCSIVQAVSLMEIGSGLEDNADEDAGDSDLLTIFMILSTINMAKGFRILFLDIICWVKIHLFGLQFLTRLAWTSPKIGIL